MRLNLSQLKNWVGQKFLSRPSVSNNQSGLIERLSHELRTSLTGIVGYSEFLESSSTEPMVNFTAKIIRESSQGLTRTSISFFDLHRLDMDQIQVSCLKFSICELVRTVVRLNQKQAIERNVNLIFTCSAEIVNLDIFADTQRVRQVVDALVFDAVQAVENGKSIQVDISVDDNKNFIRLMINSLDSMTDGLLINLRKVFWSSAHYKFKLQEGPGVELALAKKLIYFLQGYAEYHCETNEIPRLIIKLPMHYK